MRARMSARCSPLYERGVVVGPQAVLVDVRVAAGAQTWHSRRFGSRVAAWAWSQEAAPSHYTKRHPRRAPSPSGKSIKDQIECGWQGACAGNQDCAGSCGLSWLLPVVQAPRTPRLGRQGTRAGSPGGAHKGHSSMPGHVLLVGSPIKSRMRRSVSASSLPAAVHPMARAGGHG